MTVTLHGRCIRMDVLCCGAVHALRVMLQHHLSMEYRGPPLTFTIRLRRYAGAGCLLTGAMLSPKKPARTSPARGACTGGKGTGDPLARLESDGATGPRSLSTAAAPSAPGAVTIVGPAADAPGTGSFVTNSNYSCRRSGGREVELLTPSLGDANVTGC